MPTTNGAMMRWYVTVLKKYAVFSGRARRKEYWIFTLINSLIVIVLSVVDAVLNVGLDLADIAETSPGQLRIITSIYTLAVLLPTIAVTVRRLHDTNRTGRWVLLGAVAPTATVLSAMGGSGSWVLIGLAVGVIGSIVLLIFTVLKGTHGDNEYGPDPTTSDLHNVPTAADPRN